MKSLFFMQAQPTGTSQSADDRSQAFKPVQGGTELQSGERLLVISYMAIWLCVVALVIVSFRKQARIDRRISSLESALSRARGEKSEAPARGKD
ncbi:MAG: CcmD family protein [Polyangiaceae bacterium]|nr:CcmD family protein [Polyangiaceae bacterium]